MTGVDVEALRVLLAKATPGPLLSEQCYSDGGGRYVSVRNARYEEAVGEYGVSEADAELFAAAVNALPALLAKTAEYEALVARVEAAPVGVVIQHSEMTEIVWPSLRDVARGVELDEKHVRLLPVQESADGT